MTGFRKAGEFLPENIQQRAGKESRREASAPPQHERARSGSDPVRRARQEGKGFQGKPLQDKAWLENERREDPLLPGMEDAEHAGDPGAAFETFEEAEDFVRTIGGRDRLLETTTAIPKSAIHGGGEEIPAGSQGNIQRVVALRDGFGLRIMFHTGGRPRYATVSKDLFNNIFPPVGSEHKPKQRATPPQETHTERPSSTDEQMNIDFGDENAFMERGRVETEETVPTVTVRKEIHDNFGTKIEPGAKGKIIREEIDDDGNNCWLVDFEPPAGSMRWSRVLLKQGDAGELYTVEERPAQQGETPAEPPQPGRQEYQEFANPVMDRKEQDKRDRRVA